MNLVVNDRKMIPEILDSKSRVITDFDFCVSKDTERGNKSLFDQSYECLDGIRDVLSSVRRQIPVVLVSGKAGSGKTKLISYLKETENGGQQINVAPTGLAAFGIDGDTIHSIFQLPVGVIDLRQLEPMKGFSKLLMNANRIVIDEISMARADIVDAIDLRLRQSRNPFLPFGGVQVVMFGDFFQLPPVATKEEYLLLKRMGYQTPFAFSAKVFEESDFHAISLDRSWRQKDEQFVDILDCIRTGNNIDYALGWLNDHCVGDHRSGFQPVMLTTTNEQAERHNRIVFENGCRNGRESRSVFGFMRGDLENVKGTLPAPVELKLYDGMRVLATRNDPDGRFQNGSLGTVCGFEDRPGRPDVYVKFDGNAEITRVGMTKWLIAKQVWNDRTEKIDNFVVGEMEQLPLCEGSALTIHKAQGMSLEDVRLDPGKGLFAPGQLYVALSRATSIDGLSFSQPICSDDVRVDRSVMRFQQHMFRSIEPRK